MSRKRTDFRSLRARREAALQRPELKERVPRLEDDVETRRLIDEAVARGVVTRCPPAARKPR